MNLVNVKYYKSRYILPFVNFNEPTHMTTFRKVTDFKYICTRVYDSLVLDKNYQNEYGGCLYLQTFQMVVLV
jgi:hypothetical protein